MSVSIMTSDISDIEMIEMGGSQLYDQGLIATMRPALIK